MASNHLIILALTGIIGLTACGNKTDANEKNFGIAMNNFLEKRGRLCLSFEHWPVQLNQSELAFKEKMAFSKANQMAVLESIGLVKSSDKETKRFNIKVKHKEYILTDAATPFIGERTVPTFSLEAGEGTAIQKSICWGKRGLDRIVKWEGPLKSGNFEVAGITYTYKINNMAEWAKNPKIQAAFPEIKSVIANATTQENQHAVKLTSQGWEAQGL